MKKLLKWLALLIFVSVAGVVILVYNRGLIKGALERLLSKLTGYSIQLHGDLNIRPGQTTEVTARNIRISGPEQASHDELVSVRDLKLSFLTTSLFKDIIILESLMFEGLDLNRLCRQPHPQISSFVGIEDEVGSVELGKVAYLLIVKGDPSRNIPDTRNIEYVIKAGRRVNRRALVFK